MRRLGCLILVAAAVIAVLLAGNFLYGWNASGPLEEQRTIVIRSGSSLATAAATMESEGVIKSADAFLTRAKILGGSEPIKAGEFEIPAGASNALILDILQGGKTVQRLITVPEGTPSILVYEKLMDEKLLKGDIPVPAEGSILPDSYSFERGEQRAAVLLRMQKAMKDTIAELWPKRSQATIAKSPKEAIILASIVEKETAVARERPTVAGVRSARTGQPSPRRSSIRSPGASLWADGSGNRKSRRSMTITPMPWSACPRGRSPIPVGHQSRRC